MQWQSLGTAEPWTHLLGFGELRNRSESVGAVSSCVRMVSACGFETSATAGQGRCFRRPSGACGLMHRDGQTDIRPSLTTPPLQLWEGMAEVS